ncbi:MAG TPA: peptide ABC transporter substrate-binding protein [Candidatus Limnocylindrales bacterium]
MRKRLFSILSVAALVATACSTSSSTPTAAPASQNPATNPPPPTAVASPTPVTVSVTGTTYKAEAATVTTGKLVLAEWQFPDTVNPYFAQAETDIEVSGSMFDNLINVTPDLKYTPNLASNVPTVDNGGVKIVGSGMDVTWTLKPGMKWSDGSAITCADILGTWKWIMDPANTGLAGGTIGWEDITGVDGGTGTDCVMHFGKVYEGYLSLVAPLFPAAYLASVPVKDAATKLYPLSNLASGVYSGSYIPVSLKTDAQITLAPNPNWATISGHAPWLSSVIWKYYGAADTMIAGYKANEYDLGQDLNDADIPALASIDQTQVVAHDSLTYEVHVFNNARLKTTFGTDATTIIKAIKLATDRKAIAAGPLAGNVTVSNNFVSPLTWYSKSVGGSTDADPTTAATLLANAGWTKGADGYLAKAGKPLALDYCTTTRQVRQDTLKLVASQLKAVGIKVNVNAKPSSDVFGDWNGTKPDTLCNIIHGNFDVAEFAYVSPLDPLGGYNVYHSSGIPDLAPHNGQNVTRTSLPALDAAYDTVKSSVDFVKVRDAMFAIQDIYGSDQNTYELPLYFRKDVWLVNPKLHNFTGNPTTSAAEWNIGDWWIG